MNACTFFGHSNSPQNLRVAIKEKITELIEQHGVELFYVGNHGQFDSMALSSLKELAKIYPHISYNVVLAYFPKEKSPEENTLLPEGIELCHPKFAIEFRNKWMLERSDYVISYITHSWGSAYKFCEKAKHQGKNIINIEQREQIND